MAEFFPSLLLRFSSAGRMQTLVTGSSGSLATFAGAAGFRWVGPSAAANSALGECSLPRYTMNG